MRRIPELDALRGLAALAIVIYHLWMPGFTPAGTAVDLFFVMSGYLITAIILRERGRPGFLRRFYIRRSLRIWPIYYLALFATVAACRITCCISSGSRATGSAISRRSSRGSGTPGRWRSRSSSTSPGRSPWRR